MIYTTKIPSPAGKITLASDGIHLIGLWFDGQQYFAHTIKEETKENPGLFIFTQTRDWLDRYFSGRQPAVRELSLRPDGSVFRREVWKLLCEIPYGEVTTYGAIARKIAAGRGQEKCPHRPSAVPSGIIPSPSLSPATGSSAATEALPAMAAGWN